MTYAVRDSEIDGHKVKKGEMMGLCGKKLLALEKTPEKAALKLLTAMADEETQFVNIFTGADVTPAAASRLEEQARRKLGTHVELAVIPGGAAGLQLHSLGGITLFFRGAAARRPIPLLGKPACKGGDYHESGGSARFSRTCRH